MRLAPDFPYHADGLVPLMFAVCFGASAMLVATVFLIGYCAVRTLVLESGMPEMQPRTCLLPSMLSGLIWSLGNAGGVLATQEPLGLTVGGPRVHPHPLTYTLTLSRTPSHSHVHPHTLTYTFTHTYTRTPTYTFTMSHTLGLTPPSPSSSRSPSPCVLAPPRPPL